MLVSNAVYGLPTFKKWGSFASNVLGDWQLNGIVTVLSGIPLDVHSGISGQYFGLFADAPGGFRPDLVSGVPIYLHGPDKQLYLNPAAFKAPAPGQFGNLKRGFVRQPGLTNVDFSIAKNWKFKERYGLQFRAEMFNLFNHANFNGFDPNLGFVADRCGASQPLCGPEGKFKGTFTGTNTGPTGNFGHLTSDRGPRNIQFGLKFNF